MRKFVTSRKLEKILGKLMKKDKSLYGQVKKKIAEVISSSGFEHYKSLRHDLRNFKRVHVGHFVLIFRFDRSRDLIMFEDFEHHDNIYGK